MGKYWDIFVNGYKGYADYLWYEITHPNWHNYFYWLIGVSLFFFILEVVIPWRKNQPRIRQDFWLDAFYMFFNFFLFSLIIYNAASYVIVNLLNDGILAVTGFNLQASNPLNLAPMWLILIVGFVVRDFIQWWTHRLLHYSDRLWQFHKVHHSVQQMGFAAHLRYHWMENVVYRTIEYIPLALLGIGLYDFFIIHIFTLAVGHYNHSNISVSGRVTGGVLGGLIGLVLATNGFETNLMGSDPVAWQQILVVISSAALGSLALGPVMKIIFNNPEMHIWHHSYELPEDRRYGINFGITLALWDYLFGTAHVPESGRDIRLGYPGVEELPHDFIHQNLYGFQKLKPEIRVEEKKELSVSK
jgi:sterol desaturase/sphingolipid hydroxylase (fatty acid hydroxylase superfamily)